ERNLSDIAEDDGAIKRALDQAAFKAGQEGSVIIFAPANQAVLTALREWQESARGKTVSLAPLSAVLRKQ
ncbi:MAG: divergent polysaccharide deacetylase family protein, partial [Deltaproteobacteria bacterium]